MQSVLAVDDELDLLETYNRLLRRQGYRVVRATNRAEAMRALETEVPTLIVADMRLPDGNGLDVVRAARATAKPPTVIVVTGFASEATRREAMAAGAAAFVAKPFSAAAFLDLVKKLVPPVA